MPETEIKVAARFERTNRLPPGAGREDWEAYFERYKLLWEAKRAKGGYEIRFDEELGMEVAVELTEDAEPVMTVIQQAQEIEFADLPQTPRGIANRLAKLGYKVYAKRSVTHHEPVLYLNDSKKTDARKGDVRIAGYDMEHFALLAYAGDKAKAEAFIAMEAGWERKLEEGASTPLIGARTYDPVLGHEWTKTATPLNEWVDMIAPKPPPKPKKPKAEKTEERDPEADLLQGGEWNG